MNIILALMLLFPMASYADHDGSDEPCTCRLDDPVSPTQVVAPSDLLSNLTVSPSAPVSPSR